MDKNYSKIKEVINYGYNFEFGIVLDKAFRNYKKIVGIAGVGILLVVIIVMIVYLAIIGIFFGFTDFAQTMSNFRFDVMSGTAIIGVLLFGVLLSALIAPIKAGFLKMASNADHDEPFGIENLFEYYREPYFKKLFIAELLITLITSGLSTLLHELGSASLGSLISNMLIFLLCLATPLIVFANLNPIEAMLTSVKLVAKRPVAIFGLFFIAIIFCLLGLLGFCIGIFFTAPLFISVLYSIYNEILPLNEVNELDEVGTF